MRPQDKRYFLEAASKFGLWILVRRTNSASLQYIGQRGYSPKRIDCKANTADFDVAPYKLAGLVVDPNLHPKAFKPTKLEKAKRHWMELKPHLGKLYKVDSDPKSRHYGGLKFQESYIHGDYDLYDIIDIKQPHRNLAAVETLHGQAHMRGPNFYRVKQYIDPLIGAEMIQHSGEAQYADHSEQSIDAFGPNGEDVTILNEFSVRAWYEQRFGGRRTLG